MAESRISDPGEGYSALGCLWYEPTCSRADSCGLSCGPLVGGYAWSTPPPAATVKPAAIPASLSSSASDSRQGSPAKPPKETTMPRNPPTPDQQRPGRLPAPGMPAIASPVPGSAGPRENGCPGRHRTSVPGGSANRPGGQDPRSTARLLGMQCSPGNGFPGSSRPSSTWNRLGDRIPKPDADGGRRAGRPRRPSIPSSPTSGFSG
jgi:hypothetical protein